MTDTRAALRDLHHLPLQPEYMVALHHWCWYGPLQLLKPTCSLLPRPTAASAPLDTARTPYPSHTVIKAKPAARSLRLSLLRNYGGCRRQTLRRLLPPVPPQELPVLACHKLLPLASCVVILSTQE